MFRARGDAPWKRRLGIVALEVFSVVLAVLLALAANDWRDARAAERLTHRSVAAIAEELERNAELVRSAHEHHQRVRSLIRERFAEEDELSDAAARALLDELYRIGIVKPGAVVDTAWSTAQLSGAIQGVDFDVALSLARAYAFQDDYRMATAATNSAMSLARFLGSRPSDYVLGVHESVNVHWWLEERLIEAYDEALRHIGRSTHSG